MMVMLTASMMMVMIIDETVVGIRDYSILMTSVTDRKQMVLK